MSFQGFTSTINRTIIMSAFPACNFKNENKNGVSEQILNACKRQFGMLALEQHNYSPEIILV